MTTYRYRPPNREVWMYAIDPGKLKRRRKSLGLSQQQVAVLSRCTQQYVSLLESGRDRDCSEDIAIRICRTLQVELEDYFEARELLRNPGVATTSRGRRNGSAA
jgi:transcriptional regulator with XRE-family HTH domain